MVNEQIALYWHVCVGVFNCLAEAQCEDDRLLSLVTRLQADRRFKVIRQSVFYRQYNISTVIVSFREFKNYSNVF